MLRRFGRGGSAVNTCTRHQEDKMSARMMPAEIKRNISYELDRTLPGRFPGYVNVTPRDENGRKCAAWCAHHYEVFAYPIDLSAPLEPIANVLRDLPGAVAVTLRTIEEYVRDKRTTSRAERPGVYARLPAQDGSA
jgi:hypothetical protein